MKRPKPPTAPELQELLTALLWVSGGVRRWRWARSVRPVINQLAAHLGYDVPIRAKLKAVATARWRRRRTALMQALAKPPRRRRS